MNKTLQKISITGITFSILLISLSLPLFTYAQGTETETPTAEQCTAEMRTFMKEKSQELRTYFEQHFQSKTMNSTLLELAMQRFKKYKIDLRTKLTSYSPRAGLGLVTEVAGATQCAKEVDDEIAKMEKLFQQYYTETAEIKSTSMLQTKLESINKKLRDLSIQVTSMYGKWEALKIRIPCFINKCLSG